MTTTTLEPPRKPLSRNALTLVVVFILVGGALRSVEAGCQNSLKLSLKNVWLCGVISYAVAFTGFLVFILVARMVTKQWPWPTRADVRALPWWAPFGGLLGGAAILAMIAVASDVGVSTFNALIIAGQMFAALLIDHFGVMGFPRHRVTGRRLAACAMIIVGIYLMAKY
ncbi:DMT family transporter [Nocardia thraciensis]